MNIVINNNQNYKLSELAQAVENSTDDLFYVVKQVDGKDVAFAITREQLIQGISGGDPTIQDNGAIVGTRPNINFIEGANVTFTITDDPANDRVNITVNSASAISFESVSKNLKAWSFVLNYTADVLTSIVYTDGIGTITKTFVRTGDVLTSIILSGDTPAGIDLTKTLNYTSTVLTSITYS